MAGDRPRRRIVPGIATDVSGNENLIVGNQIAAGYPGVFAVLAVVRYKRVICVSRIEHCATLAQLLKATLDERQPSSTRSLSFNCFHYGPDLGVDRHEPFAVRNGKTVPRSWNYRTVSRDSHPVKSSNIREPRDTQRASYLPDSIKRLSRVHHALGAGCF